MGLLQKVAGCGVEGDCPKWMMIQLNIKLPFISDSNKSAFKTQDACAIPHSNSTELGHKISAIKYFSRAFYLLIVHNIL